LTEFIAALPADDFWIGTLLSLTAAAGGFYYGFRSLRRARIIEDVPTARIRSAHQGYVELEGEAELMEGEPIRAPLSGTVCCWWRYQIHRRDSDGDWILRKEKSSDELFLLRDGTGRCIIDPEGAEVTPKESNTWYGSTEFPATPWHDPGGSPLPIVPTSGVALLSDYRYKEEYLFPDNHLYAIGQFRSLDDHDHQRARGEITRELLRKWKQRPEVMRSFDRNGDGTVDPQEWEQVRRSAAAQAHREYKEEQERQIPHILCKPQDRRHPFLLSPKPQDKLAGRYRLIAGLGILVFFVAGAAAALMLSTRLMG
jgi:hypothetical protein